MGRILEKLILSHLVKKFPAQGSLSCSQEHTTGPYREPD